MGAVVLPVATGLAELGAAIVGATGASALLEDVVPKVRGKERDCADTPEESECKQCKLGTGLLGQAREPRFINAKNLVNYRYQLYIANLHAAPERFVFTRYHDTSNEELSITWERIKEFFNAGGGPMTTTEWLYNGIWFDGFWRRYCTVVEAKGNYEWMFPANSKKTPWFADMTLAEWRRSYARQSAAVASASPRARLEWHFMQERPWLKALQIRIPAYVARHTPLDIRSL